VRLELEHVGHLGVEPIRGSVDPIDVPDLEGRASLAPEMTA
jgi:hypothetical protein